MAKSKQDNLDLKWPLWGTFQLDKIIHLKSEPEIKYSQIKQNGLPILTGMQKPLKDFKSPNNLYGKTCCKRLMKN